MDENKTQQNNQGKLKTVHTYLSDMADTVRANEISVIKVALAEQNKHEREDLYRKAEGTPTKKIFWVLGGLIIIAAGIYGSTFIFKEKVKNEIPEQIQKDESIISYDESSSIILADTDSLINKINLNIRENSKLDKMDLIKIIKLFKENNGQKENIGIEEIISKMKLNAPSSLVRSLSNYYMVGTYTRNVTGSSGISDSIPKLFIIFQSKDYSYTYAGMLEWEKTLSSDMFNLFELNTTDSIDKIDERKWRDVIINNKDARVLFNEDNRPILYYVFVDKSNLIIADNQKTISEIISRLIISNARLQ